MKFFFLILLSVTLFALAAILAHGFKFTSSIDALVFSVIIGVIIGTTINQLLE